MLKYKWWWLIKKKKQTILLRRIGLGKSLSNRWNINQVPSQNALPTKFISADYNYCKSYHGSAPNFKYRSLVVSQKSAHTRKNTHLR